MRDVSAPDGNAGEAFKKVGVVMMWRFFNWLLGWHYAVVISPVMDFRYLRRVRADASGRKYVAFIPGEIWFLLDSGETDNGYKWEALTWSHEKK